MAARLVTLMVLVVGGVQGFEVTSRDIDAGLIKRKCSIVRLEDELKGIGER